MAETKRSTEDLIDELCEEGRQFSRVALVVGFEESSEFVWSDDASALEMSAAAKKGSIMAVEGGAGVGVTLRTLVTRRSAIEAHGGV
ncbi:MAG: hypothetical protein ABSH52_34585, partial [Terriglobia bacterium]